MGWQVLKRDLILDRWPYIRIYKDRVRLEDGRTVDDYYQFEAAPYVIVFPVMADGRIALIRHYRHAVGRYVIDLPGGNIDDDDPLAAAQRELLEEVGLVASRWDSLGVYKVSPIRGITDAHCFLAQGAEIVADPTADDLQRTERMLFPVDEVHQLWASGQWAIMDTAAVAGLALARLGHF